MRDHRQAGLAALLGSTLMLLAFSFAAGFSIGRFTAAIPVMLIGVMLGAGRGALGVINALIAAAIVYFMCSWLLSSLVLQGGVFSWLFGAWAIPLYALLALAAYAAAATTPTRSERGDISSP